MGTATASASASARLTSAGDPDPIDPADRRRWVEENCRRNGDPTPREIATRCLMIRAGWDAQTELARRGVAWERYGPAREVGHLANPMALGMPSRVFRRNGRPTARRVG